MAIRLVDMEIASLRQQVKELCAARDWLAREKERVEKQRDEARELVRGAAEAGAWDADIHEMRQAVARWDEEAKRSGSKALREWTERGEADIARWVEEEKKR